MEKNETKKKEIEKLRETIQNNETKFNSEINKKTKEIEKLNETIEKYKEDSENNVNEYNKMVEENCSLKNEISQLKIEINKEKYQNLEIKKSLQNEKVKNIVVNNLIKQKEIEIKNFENKLKLIEDIILDKTKNINNINIINKEEEEAINCEDKDREYGKVGLKNEELNCYMSSVIQILKNIENFSLKIIDIQKEDDILESLQRLIKELYYSKEKSVSISEFKRDFSQKYHRFEGRKNNDSTCFLIYLLQYLHKIFNQPNKKKTNINPFKDLGLNKLEKTELNKFLNNYESKNNSFIIDLFYGYQMNKVLCSGCNNSQISFQSFNILNISLMDEKKKLKSLEQCLNCYLITKDQKGIPGFDCSNCSKKLLSHLTSIIKLPNILIINLKRVGENIVYYHEIDIPFILKTDSIEKLKKLQKKYELIGFVRHLGDEKGGHNIAYSKNIFDNKWYMFNDETVKKENEDPSTDKSFLLFYKILENVKN